MSDVGKPGEGPALKDRSDKVGRMSDVGKPGEGPAFLQAPVCLV
jgi:hypothetical protein